ncbi:MAG: hypothetical protein LBU74_01030 [Methanobacteriaceae archaeon]|jgi:hypothetical protein|nr:hypothetical protein [Candidatus Methanorudis spinitermitis]
MWTFEYYIETKASASDIWKILADVENWNKWIDSLEYSTLDGNFENGTLGTCKGVNGAKSTFRLKNVVVNKSFIIQTKIPLGTTEGVHEIINENGSLKIKLGINMYGPLTFIFKRIISKEAENIPISAKKLVELVEK